MANVPRDYPVVVLNETRIRGLAADVASDLRAKGWTVTGVGNWQGAIPETTVYYPAGQRSRALRLAADVGANRVRPLVQHMLRNRLTPGAARSARLGRGDDAARPDDRLGPRRAAPAAGEAASRRCS